MALPLEWGAEGGGASSSSKGKQARDGLEAGAVLGLSYGALQRWARAHAARYDVRWFAWDWRRDPQEAADAFATFVDALSAELGLGHGARRAVLATHSTGTRMAVLLLCCGFVSCCWAC